jgi:hypothetical protein
MKIVREDERRSIQKDVVGGGRLPMKMTAFFVSPEEVASESVLPSS